MSSIIKNESELISYRTLTTPTQLSIRVFIDQTGSPKLQKGGLDSVLQPNPIVNDGGQDDVLNLENNIENGN